MGRHFITFVFSIIFLVGCSECQRRNYGYSRSNSRNATLPTLRIASFLSKPFLFERESSDGSRLVGNARYEGFVKDMLEEISRISNFKYRILLSEDGKYGTLRDDGQWTGMVGMIQNNKADMIAADLTITSQRLAVLDFSRPFLSSPLTILTKAYDTSGLISSIPFDFFAPYSVTVWILFLVAFIVTILAFWLASRCSPYEQWPYIYPREFNLANSAWFLFSGFFRGSNYTPKTLSTRILAAGWWIFVIVMILVYALTLKSFLAGNWSSYSSSKVSNSVEELLEDPNFRFAVIEGGASQSFLKNSANSLHQEIYSRIESNAEESFLSSFTEGFNMLRADESKDNGLGLVMEEATADYVKGTNCGLYTVGNLDDRQFAFGFKRGSNYRVIFSQSILRLRESGQLQVLRDRWWKRQSRNCPKITSQTTGAYAERGTTKGIENMMWPFVFLAIILVVGLILALLELIYSIWSNKKQEKKAGTLIRKIKEALCGCCQKKPPLTDLENRQTQTYYNSNT